MDEECWQVPRQLCYTGRQNDTTEEREYDIMMNPASLMKIMNARNKFVENHPKFAAFLNAVFSAGITSFVWPKLRFCILILISKHICCETADRFF